MSDNIIYAVESYSEESGYSRHEVGSRDEMMSCLRSMIEKSLEDKVYDNYYRLNEVSETDYNDWNEQIIKLPDIPNKERIFGEWVQMGVAAKYLDVTFGRVFNLATDNEIRSNEVGRNKLVNVHDVVQRKINKPRAGRPSKKSTQEIPEREVVSKES